MKSKHTLSHSALVFGTLTLAAFLSQTAQAEQVHSPDSASLTTQNSASANSATAVASATSNSQASLVETSSSEALSQEQETKDAPAQATTPVTAASSPSAEPQAKPAYEGQTVDMQILSTTDLHTNLVNYDYYQDKPSQTVGLAKTALLIDAARKENPNTVLVDSGDTLQGTPFGTYEALINPVKEGETHPMYKAFELLGYDAETLGNHEFNYGLDFVDRMVKEAKINIVNANIRDAKTGENYYTPYKIIDKTFRDVNGQPVTVKIGITGVLPPQILVWDKANLEGKVVVDEPIEAVKKMVPLMKADGADFILVAAHSGIGDDVYTPNEENEGYQIAAIDGVDAVATGHSHADFPNGDGTGYYATLPGVDDINGLINGKPVVMAGKFGDHLGIMDIQLVFKDGKWQVASSKSRLEKIDTESDAADQSLVDLVAHEHQGTIEYVRQEVGETTAPITSYFAQVQDDPSIQIVNNAQLWYGKQQVAGTPDANLPILSAAAPFKAGTRGDATYYTDIPKGPLAIKNVADLYLYDNVTALVKVNGAQLKEWLEMAAGQFKQIDPTSAEPQQLVDGNYRSYNFDVIDGVTYQFDVTQPNKYDAKGKLVNPDASRVRNLQYQGKEVDPNQEFIVVTNNYRATGNFPGVRDAASTELLNLENRQAIIDYIVSEKVINPTADGNWTFVNNWGDADVRFDSSANAQSHLAGQESITYMGASEQKGFAQYRIQLPQQTDPALDPADEQDPASNQAPSQDAKVSSQDQSIRLSNQQRVDLPSMSAMTYQSSSKPASVVSESASKSNQELPETSDSDTRSLVLLGMVSLSLASYLGLNPKSKRKKA